MHGNFNRNSGFTGLGFTRRIKHIRMQDGFVFVDVINKALHATRESKVFFFAGTLIDQTHADAVVQERQFTQTLGQNFVMEFNRAKNFWISQKVHFRTAVFCFADHSQRRNFNTVLHFDNAINRLTLIKLHEILFAITTNDELKPLR